MRSSTLMQFAKDLQTRVPWLLSMITATAISMAISGCLPQDVPILSPSNSNESITYADFKGLESALTVNGSRVTLKWTGSSDTRVVAYNVYDASFRFSPRLIRTVAAPADQVTLSGLSAQALYSFRVRAADANNLEDSNTNDIKAIPYAGLATAQVISSTSVKLTFADGSNSDEILIFCKTSTNQTYEQLAAVRTTSRTSVVVEDLQPGVEYTCRAALDIDGFIDNNENTLTFSPMGQAHHLVFSTQPSNGNAGQNLSGQPVVKMMDENNNIVSGGPDSTALVTLSISDTSPTTGSVKGEITVQAVAGVATFSGINVEEAGQKILKATKQDTSAQIFGTAEMAVVSNPFLISPGSVSVDNSTIAISPEVPPATPLTANGTDSYTVKIKLQDAFHNPIVGVRPTFTSNISGDTLTQPNTNTNNSGETTGAISSTIADVAPNLRKLSIASPSGLSSVFVMAPMKHGTASKLAFSVQPVNSPAGAMGMAPLTIEVQDAQGNRVTSGDAASGSVSISIASNVNGAALTGTATQDLVNGVIAFNDLGIDKTGNGYRLIASSGSLSPAYSNTFNVTAGVPKKIAITGPTSVTSGSCSSAITVQLQDLGNNPTNAIQSTPVVISGLASGSVYSSSNCGGSALGTTMTFTAGTNTRTIYFKDNKAEQVNLSFADTSAVLTAGTITIAANPAKIGLIAQAASPAAPGTPLRVVAGQCSTKITITPMGNDGNPGPNYIPLSVTMTGVSGSGGQLYSDSGCTQSVSPSTITLPINTGPDYAYRLYIKDNKSEDLNVSVTDNGGMMTTTTATQSITIAPSTLSLTGPTTVVAGQCSAVFRVQMRDMQANATLTTADRALTINGIPDTSVGRFYTTSACSGSGSRTSLTFPEGSDTLQVYFKSVVSDVLSLSISDPAGEMTTSPTITLSVSPSALLVTTPVAGSANTNICAGPFYVKTLDGVGTQTNAVGPITVNLTGQGTAGSYYSDSGCSSQISAVSFVAGQNQRPFYFRGYYPESGLTMTATDQASVLTPGSANWVVTAAKGWLGTASSRFDSNNNELWFRTNAKAVAARNDGIYSATSMAFSPDNKYLYIVDYDQHRILKYDYENHAYIGWVGRFWNNGGIGVAGSNLTTPSDAACVNTQSWAVVPGWCVNGQSQYDDTQAAGALRNPYDIVDDGTYIYVSNYSGHAITRYNSTTGAFDGYIGLVGTPTGMTPATGGPAGCSTATAGNPTPGWCKGGTSSMSTTYPNPGDGRLRLPRALAYDSDYLYVATSQSLIRYDKASGAFSGWIGMVATTPTGGADATACMAKNNDQMTPGWCTGGSAKEADANTYLGQIGGFNYPEDMIIVGDEIIVFHGNGKNVRYDRTTGAVLGTLSSITNFNWKGLRQIATNGTNYFVADAQRILKTDSSGLIEGWMGKVSNNLSMSGNPGCNSLAINANTPGWCLGGSSRPGTDETSFRNLSSIVYDGHGKLLVGQDTASGNIRKFDATTGAYEGMLALESASPKKWSNDADLATERNGFDDDSMFNPQGITVAGDYVYMAEYSSSRVKKFNRKTGDLVGWIGALTSSPTSGSTGCAGANPFAAAPGWCLGANFLPSSLFWDTSMINSTTNGIFLNPVGVAADANYLYVTDRNLHRISRYSLDTGEPKGWIGKIAVSPTDGAAGCNGAAVNTFTPGWCYGGRSTNGSGDGELYHPSGLTVTGGNIYVVDTVNRRISSYDAANGTFNGWIGRVNTAPSVCSTVVKGTSTVVQSGWCKGGSSMEADYTDQGGGFRFWDDWRGDVTTDGTYLYVTNFRNIRIDKFNLNGEFIASVKSREDQYINSWTSNGATIAAMGGTGCSYPYGIWTDGVNIYGTSAYPCQRNGDSFNVYKMNASTGQMVGWQGGIDPSNLPNDGETGCAGATSATPGWCRGGRTMLGLRMGQFSGVRGYITGDDHYIYVTDETGNRITRIPK